MTELQFHIPDLPPLPIKKVNVLATKNGVGECVISITTDQAQVIFGIRPTDFAIVRCIYKQLGTTKPFEPVSLSHLPGNMVDIAQTKAIEAQGIELPSLPFNR